MFETYCQTQIWQQSCSLIHILQIWKTLLSLGPTLKTWKPEGPGSFTGVLHGIALDTRPTPWRPWSDKHNQSTTSSPTKYLKKSWIKRNINDSKIMKFHKHIIIFLGVLMWFYVILPCTFSPSPYPHLPMAPGFCASTCRATTKPPESTFQATWPAGWDAIWWTKIEGDLRNLVYQFGNNFCQCLFVPCCVLRVFQQVPPPAGFSWGMNLLCM